MIFTLIKSFNTDWNGKNGNHKIVIEFWQYEKLFRQEYRSYGEESRSDWLSVLKNSIWKRNKHQYEQRKYCTEKGTNVRSSVVIFSSKLHNSSMPTSAITGLWNVEISHKFYFSRSWYNINRVVSFSIWCPTNFTFLGLGITLTGLWVFRLGVPQVLLFSVLV